MFLLHTHNICLIEENDNIILWIIYFYVHVPRSQTADNLKLNL